MLDDSIEDLLDEDLNFQGWLLGDPHIKNFGAYYWRDRWWWLANDFDDAGQGPFVFDLLRLLTVHEDLSSAMRRDAVDAYLEGLCGVEPQLPNWLISIVESDSLQRRDIDSKKKRFHRGLRDLYPLGRALKKQLEPFLPPGRVRDAAITERLRGGSVGLARYWILLEDAAGRLRHLEFKELGETAAVDLYQINKLDQIDRLTEIKSYYWPSSEAALHKIVEIKGQKFLLRERLGGQEALKKAYKLPSRLGAFHRLAAQELGYRHGLQEEGERFCKKMQQNRLEVRAFKKRILRASEKVTDVFAAEHAYQKVSKRSYELFGDVRFRAQNRKREDFDPRFQKKIRARFGAEFFVSEAFSSRFSVSTGRSPTSANANLGDSFSYKDFGIHEASITYEPVNQMQFVLGKMELPFIVFGDSELMWDSTLTPEGMALKWSRGQGLMRPFLNSGYFILSENYRKKRGINLPDHTVFVAQLGSEFHLGRWRFTLAGGPVRYSQIAGSRFRDISEDESFGNSEGRKNRFLYDYHLKEAMVELSYRSMLELHFFAHGIENSEGEERRAHRWGAAIEYANLELMGAYRRVERDAVFGFFTESNFAFGGTDQKGYEANVRWKPEKNFFITLTHHWATQGLREKLDAMKRFHLDFTARF